MEKIFRVGARKKIVGFGFSKISDRYGLFPNMPEVVKYEPRANVEPPAGLMPFNIEGLESVASRVNFPSPCYVQIERYSGMGEIIVLTTYENIPDLKDGRNDIFHKVFLIGSGLESPIRKTLSASLAEL